METDSFQNNNSMFAEMLSNSNEKIFLEAIDQIFDQENPVSNVQNPDFADFEPKLEKMYDKFCDSLDMDLAQNNGQSINKDYSTEFDSEENSFQGNLIFTKKKIYLHDYLIINRENVNKTKNLVMKKYCSLLEMIENFSNAWKEKI